MTFSKPFGKPFGQPFGRVFGDAASGFNPITIASIQSWRDASDTATITDVANVVSAISDKGPAGRTLSANGTGLTTNSVTIGGLNAILFDGVDYLDSTATPFGNISATFAVMFRPTVVDNGTDSIISTQGANDFQIDAGTTPAFQCDVVDSGLGIATLIATDRIGLDTFVILILDLAGGTSELRVNGVSVDTSTFTGPFDATLDYMVGTNRAANNMLEMNFGEDFIFHDALSGSDLAGLEEYSQAKWGWT